jgi:UDP-2,3-diacylglucosamine hydrolase
MIRAYFVSDVHIKSMEERNSQTLLRFFHSLAAGEDERPTHLFLVGDIFDLWIGKHEYFIKRFKPFVTAISALRELGVEIHYFEGNHDLYLAEFWEKEVGVRVHTDAEYFKLGDHIVRVEHGDMINPDDRGYLLLRSVLRSPPLKWLSRRLPSKVIGQIGERASSASRHYTSTAKELPETEIRTLIRNHAERVYHDNPFDLIISGHVHVDDDHIMEIGSQKVRSVNLGSWYTKPRVLLLETPPLRYRFVSLT